MFSVHTTPEEFNNATITSHFGFVFEENSVREIRWLSWWHRFRTGLFSKRFPFTPKRKAGVFKFLRFEERFRAGLVWTVGLTLEIKLRFQIFPVWCGRYFMPFVWKTWFSSAFKIQPLPVMCKSDLRADVFSILFFSIWSLVCLEIVIDVSRCGRFLKQVNNRSEIFAITRDPSILNSCS